MKYWWDVLFNASLSLWTIGTIGRVFTQLVGSIPNMAVICGTKGGLVIILHWLMAGNHLFYFGRDTNNYARGLDVVWLESRS